jgi:hypothetical protein
VAVNRVLSAERGLYLVKEIIEGFLELLVVGGCGEEVSNNGLDVVIESETVDDSEHPVEEPRDLGGTGGELLDLDAVLAGYVLVRQLNDEIVHVLDEDLELGTDCVEFEVVGDIVALGNNGVNELVGLINLFVAGGGSITRVGLGAESKTKESLPWLIVDARLRNVVNIGNVGLTCAYLFVDVIEGGVGNKCDGGNSHQRYN